MIAARTIGGPSYPEMIEEMDKELTNVIDDFDRAMNFEALRLANETSMLSFSQSVDSQSSSFGVGEQELLSARLKPVEAGHHRNLCCMDDTRKSLLNQIMDWVANTESVLQRNTYWFHGLPGIGKASLAPFHLCNPCQAKPPCWCHFLPEGRPGFERAHKYPSDFHLQTRHDLPTFPNHCSKTPARPLRPYSGVHGRHSFP